VTASEVAAAAEQVSETQPTADQFASQAGVDDEKDEDLVRDMNRVRSQKQPSPSQQEPSSQSKHLLSVLHLRSALQLSDPGLWLHAL